MTRILGKSRLDEAARKADSGTTDPPNGADSPHTEAPQPTVDANTLETGPVQRRQVNRAEPSRKEDANASPRDQKPADSPASNEDEAGPQTFAGKREDKPVVTAQSSPALRVALDVRTWNMSGLGTYVRELLSAMARLNLPVDWTLIGPAAYREEMPRGLRIERWVDYNAPIYGARAALIYPRLRGVDVFHYPHYNLPLARARRHIATCFDLFHMKYGSWPKRRYQALFLARLRLARAHVLTGCDKVKEELTERGLARGRVEVISLGAGRKPSPFPHEATEVRSLAGKPLKPGWLLAVGIDQPHKNFDFLISALSLFFQRRGDAPPLVWTGLKPEDAQRRSCKLHAHLKQRLALEPFASVERLEALYEGAFAMIFPSLDEGFGLPPLEAMARGVPVVCAKREPMQTLLGNAPLYFEPTDSASLWRMLDRLLDNPQLYEEIVGRGLRHAARFQWEATAAKTFNAYARAARRSDLIVAGDELERLGRPRTLPSSEIPHTTPPY